MGKPLLYRSAFLGLLSLWPALPLAAQPVFTDVFPPEEYAARRARVMAKIGDAVAIMQGTTERPGEQPLRQANQFFYVSGVVEPRAILVIDGRTHRSKLFLNPRNERRETMMFGPGLYPGDEAAKATGIETVVARDEFRTELDATARPAGPSTRRTGPKCWDARRRATRRRWRAPRRTTRGTAAFRARRPFSST